MSLTIQDMIGSYLKHKLKNSGSSGNVDIGPTGSKGDIGATGGKGDIGPTGATGSKGDIGATGATGSKGDIGATGGKGDIGPTGGKGDIGPTGPIGPSITYTNTTISFLQNNGTVYYKASLTGSLGSLSNYNELGSILNVPNISITYIAIIYSFGGNPASSVLNFGIIDMSNNIIHQTHLPSGSSIDINNPSIVEYTFPFAITTISPRCLRIAIYNGNIGGSNYVNIRSVILGFN